MSKKPTTEWINAAGQAVPAQYVPQRDKKATALVTRHHKTAADLHRRLVELREAVLDEVAAFCAWSADQNGVKVVGGAKGNVDITSFGGAMQILIRKPEYIEFDERLQQAKALIDEFLQARAKDTVDQALIKLIAAAFTTTRDGKVRADAVLAVQRRVKLDDPTWRRAMDLIEESKQAVKAKTYVRFRTRRDTESDWQTLDLDLNNAGGQE